MNAPPARPTKAGLAAEVERLTAENAALRDLVKAIGEASLMPMPADIGGHDYFRAARDMANVIGTLCQMATSDEVYLPYAARQVREERAQQEKAYKHYAPPAAPAEEPAASYKPGADATGWDAEAPDPFGPDAYLSHMDGCTCPDCRAARDEAAALPDCVCGDPATAHRDDPGLHRARCTRRGCTCPDYEVPAGRELEVLPGGAA